MLISDEQFAELKAMLDAAAGKQHSASGAVVTSLREILVRHEQMVLDVLARRIFMGLVTPASDTQSGQLNTSPHFSGGGPWPSGEFPPDRREAREVSGPLSRCPHCGRYSKAKFTCPSCGLDKEVR